MANILENARGFHSLRLEMGPRGLVRSLKAGIRAREWGGNREEEGKGEGKRRKNLQYVWKHGSSTPLGPQLKKKDGKKEKMLYLLACLHLSV